MLLRGLLALVAIGAVGLAAPDAAAAESSAGCHEPPPESPPQTFHVGGRERHAIVVMPEDYRSDRTHALIFAFHGRTNDNAKARRYFGLEEAAPSAIRVYPAALADRTGRFAWSDPADPPDALRDFALFDVMLDRIAAVYGVDLDAVFVVGHSLGASFANSLACTRAPRIRAVASVAGGIAPSDCSGAVAALLLHNPRDQAVPLREGQRARDVLLGDRKRRWSDGRVGGFECRRYGSAPNPLFWCPHGQDVTTRGRYYPHQWPEGGTRAIVEFFDMLIG